MNGIGVRSCNAIFNITEAGEYHIGAKWTQHANRAGNAPYTITHSGGSQTVTVNQQQNGGTFQTLTTLNLQPGTVTVTLTNDADGYVIADAVSLVPTDAEPNTATWTFQVSETGDYAIQARWTQHPNRATNAPYTVTHENGTDTITVNQQANGGSFQTLGTYNFTQGETYTVALTDQADGYVIADAIQVVPENGGPNRAVWQPNLDGEVEIFARWTSHPNRATNAPYIIAHANGTDTITVNQQQNGGQYVSLGTYTLDASSTVTLTDQANGYVIADAVRFVGETTGTPEPAMSGLFYVHTDHLGTPQKLTDENQTLVWDAVYEPFGQVTIQTELVTYNQRFPGQYFDAETGLHYNYFRDYDPTIGRYVQSDPIGLMGGVNTYVYAENNSLTNIDPTGEVVIVLPAIPPALAAFGKAAAFVGSAVVAGHVFSEAVDDRRKRGRDDPVAGEKPYNPGRDCDGNCNPCKETVCWQATHKGAAQWHWIEWNQNPNTCECFPKRGEGVSPPPGCKRIR